MLKTKGIELRQVAYSNDFKNIIECSEKLDLLPLTHKTSAFDAAKILKRGGIDPALCDIFHDEDNNSECLTYLFYGKAEYEVGASQSSRRDNTYLPVCFVLDAEAIEIYKVFMFDSGAFANNLYSDFLHDHMSIDDFSIEPCLDIIRDFIGVFFANNRNYYCSIPNPNLPSDTEYIEINAFLNMIRSKGGNKFDERGVSVEVLTKQKIMLEKTIKAIILPVDLMRRSEIVKKWKLNENISVITYPTFGGTPSSYNGVVRQQLYQYLNEQGFFGLEKSDEYV